MAISIKGKGKAISRKRRHLRLRKKVVGTAARPRLVVTRSARHITAQVVDDAIGQTVVSASTLEADLRNTDGDKSAKAKKVGELVAERAKAKGIDAVVFDRGGNKYHGRVAAVAAGLERLGLPPELRKYFKLHAHLDVEHSRAWNAEALAPLVAETPESARCLAEGALMRLTCGEQCFEAYRAHLWAHAHAGLRHAAE